MRKRRDVANPADPRTAGGALAPRYRVARAAVRRRRAARGPAGRIAAGENVGDGRGRAAAAGEGRRAVAPAVALGTEANRRSIVNTAADVIAGTAPWSVIQGDCVAGMRTLPDGCVHCVVTSPPSGRSRGVCRRPFRRPRRRRAVRPGRASRRRPARRSLPRRRSRPPAKVRPGEHERQRRHHRVPGNHVAQ